MAGVLPTIIYPSTVTDYNKRLLAAAAGTDASVKACTGKLDVQTQTSWQLFYAALSSFALEEPGIWGLGSRMDRAESYGSELAAWQDKLSKTCALGLPMFNPNQPPTDLVKLVQYVAWGAGAIAAAYVVGQVVSVIPSLPKRKAA
jgi:hypothetical protein